MSKSALELEINFSVNNPGTQTTVTNYERLEIFFDSLSKHIFLKKFEEPL